MTANYYKRPLSIDWTRAKKPWPSFWCAVNKLQTCSAMGLTFRKA